MREYITPNWHAVMVHLPLGLLSMGVMIEVFCGIFCRKSSMKSAGRWMILLGALTSVPAVTSGIYAYRDVVSSNTTGDQDFGDTWAETKDQQIVLRVPLSIKSSSASKATEYNVGDKISVQEFLDSAPGKALYEHLLYNSIGVGALMLVVLTYLASSNRWRRNLYIPLLLILIASKGLIIYGSHHGGIAVYQYGAAIEPLDAKVSEGKLTPMQTAKQYFPPAQSHVALAGFLLGLSLITFAVSIRRVTQHSSEVDEWYQEQQHGGAGKTTAKTGQSQSSASSSVSPAPAFTPHLQATASHGHVTIPVSSSAYPAAAQAKNAHLHDHPEITCVSGYWLLAALVAVLTLASGLWLINTWSTAGIKALFTGEQRGMYHSVLGSAILGLTLLLGLTTAIAKKSKFIVSFFSLLLVLALSAQFYVGIVLMFDGPKPAKNSHGVMNVLKFNPSEAEKISEKKDTKTDTDKKDTTKADVDKKDTTKADVDKKDTTKTDAEKKDDKPDGAKQD